MNRAGARLTVHFGERGRSEGEVIADRLMSLFRERGLRSAVLLRGGEGFGAKHGLVTSGQLTLSEDLPMIAVGVGPSELMESVAAEARSLLHEGLVTVEAATISSAPDSVAPGNGARQHDGGGQSSRLTIWSARHARIQDRPAHVSLVNSLKQSGMEAAIALPGVDGLVDGIRRRAGFFSANREVPMLVVGVGSRDAVASALAGVSAQLPDAPTETVDHLAPHELDTAGSGSTGLCRLSVYGGGSVPGTGIRRQREILRMLRAQGATGATAYFGLYGFLGSESPHGDSIHSLRRRVPVLTEVVDTAESCLNWREAISGLTGEAALMTLSPIEPLSRPGDRA